MKATYRIHSFKNAAKPHLKFVVRWKDSEGKFRTQFFEKKGEAETFQHQRQTELLNQGKEALTMPAALRVMAQECANVLAPLGKTLRDATEFFVDYLRKAGASLPIEKAIEEYEQLKRDRGTTYAYQRGIRYLLARLVAEVPGKLVSEITRADCEAAIANWTGKSAGSKNHLIKALACFFKWAQSRDYCARSPMKGVDLLRNPGTPVGILTPDELTALLNAACPEMLAYVAIGAFAGLRAAELHRLEWSEVDLIDGVIEVTAAKSKTATRRLIKIQPCLAAWLSPIAKRAGKVISVPDASIRLKELRKRAGLSGWPKNALRHSFASYHLAAFKNAAALALEMGHTGTAMIFAHYRQLVREADAINYWEIIPEAPENVLTMAMSNGQAARGKMLMMNDPVTGKTMRSEFAQGYKRTAQEYATQYGLGISTVHRYIRQGRPLDDPAAMKLLSRGSYQKTAEEYVKIYQTPILTVRRWMRFGWPLDNVDAVKKFLAVTNENKGIRAAPRIVSMLSARKAG